MKVVYVVSLLYGALILLGPKLGLAGVLGDLQYIGGSLLIAMVALNIIRSKQLEARENEIVYLNKRLTSVSNELVHWINKFRTCGCPDEEEEALNNQRKQQQERDSLVKEMMDMARGHNDR